MIQPSRITPLNTLPEPPNPAYLLYWMQASQRTRYNHALEFAIRAANDRRLPLFVVFGLMDDYPEANLRHYAFLLQGLADVHKNLAARKIRFLIHHGSPPQAPLHYAKTQLGHAALIVTDRGYTRHQRARGALLAQNAPCPVIQIESDIVVPVEIPTHKHEYAARTLRPKIHKVLPSFLVPLKTTTLKHPSLHLPLTGNIDPARPDATLKKLKLDRSVPPSPLFLGGETEARRRLAAFLKTKLPNYQSARNEPALAHSSHLSPYLHFGHLSPLELALAVKNASAPTADRDTFLEELIIRRELSINFTHYVDHYDRYAALPSWAQLSLQKHAADPRPTPYTLPQLEAAQTHDPAWNAAQTEMLKTGYMHNYMRMYWGKKILEWEATPQQAFATLLHLNNKYFLDGRDPNAFANVAWTFGLHDRPWGPERPIFGLIRYMNAAGLDRKFDMPAYIRKILALK